MGLENFWEYVIDNGWQLPLLPEDEGGNFLCPFCRRVINRKAAMDEVPVYEKVVHCPDCGEIESEESET